MGSRDDTWGPNPEETEGAADEGRVVRTTSGAWNPLDPHATVAPDTQDVGAAQRLGRYVMGAEIGRGAVGVVYEATDTALKRRVAVKVLATRHHPRPDARTRFLREAQSVASIDHPAVVRVYDYGETDGVVWFAMELVEGGTLRDLLDRNGTMDVPDAIRMVRTISQGVAAAHAKGVVHRDLKPANILLDAEGRPRVTDFGLALGPAADIRLTHEGQVMGTPAYMAPEQAEGAISRTGPRTDVFALGMLLYEALVGELPYEGTDALSVLAEVQAGTTIDLQGKRPDVPRAVHRVVARATRREPEDRYPDAAHIAADLERIEAGEEIRASIQIPHLTRARRWAIRHPAVAGAAGLALLLAMMTPVALQRRAQAQSAQQARSAVDRLHTVERRIDALIEHGDPATADAVFAAFADVPEVQGTPALGRGWLHHADRLEARDDTEGTVAALAQSFAATDDRAVQDEALIRLARSFERNLQDLRLLAVLRTIRDRGGLPGKEATLRKLWAAAEGGRLDLQAALTYLDGTPLAGPMEALSHVVQTGLPTCDPTCAILTRPGSNTPFYLWHDGDQMMVYDMLSPNTPAVHPWPAGVHLALPETNSIILSDQGRLTLDSDRKRWGHISLNTAGAPSLRWAPDLAYPGWFTRSLGSVELDGTTRTFIGQDKGLFELHSDGSVSVPSPTINAANSDVMAVTRGDYDGDGDVDLAVSVAEWRALDLRVLDPREDMSQLARTRIGEAYGLATLPRPGGDALAALVVRRYTQHMTLFDGDDRFEGLAILGMKDGELHVEQRLALSHGYYHGLNAADFDGDGRMELLGGSNAGLLVFASDEDGVWHSQFLQALQPLSIRDVDGDGDDEVICRRQDPDLLTVFALGDEQKDDDVWILGMGDDRLPRWQWPEVSGAMPVPDTGDPEIESAWRRVEVIGSLGLHREAAEQLTHLADLTSRDRTRLALFQRAAAFWADDGLTQAAGRALTRAAALSDDPLPLLETARSHLQAAVDVLGELEVVEAMLALDLPPEARAHVTARRDLLRPLLASTVELDFNNSLDPGWSIATPGLLQRQAGRGLVVNPAIDGILARLPLNRQDGPFRLELDVSIDDGAWGSRIELLLVPRGATETHREPLLQLRVDGSDGQTQVVARAVRPYAFPITQRVPGDSSWSGSLEFVYMAELKRVALEVSEPGVERYYGEIPIEHAPPTGEVDLIIRTRRPQGFGGDYVFERISMSGPGLERRPTTTRDAARALADGHPQEALTLDASLATRWLANLALRRDQQALDALTEFAKQPEARGLLTGLLRARVLQFAPTIRAIVGPRWLVMFDDAWSDVTVSARRPELVSIWTGELAELETVELSAFDSHDERLQIARLARERATALRAQGNIAGANAMLARCVEWGRTLVRDASTPTEWTNAQNSLAASLLQLSVDAFEQGDSETARAALTSALEASTTPELLRESIEEVDGLSRLLDDD